MKLGVGEARVGQRVGRERDVMCMAKDTHIVWVHIWRVVAAVA